MLRQLPLAALLHDAAEAYLVDLPKPLKDHPGFGEGYKAVERKLEVTIEARFGFGSCHGILNHSIVRHADRVALATEVRDLGITAKAPKPWSGLAKPYTDILQVGGPKAVGPRPIICPVIEWDWREMERQFLLAFERLGGKR